MARIGVVSGSGVSDLPIHGRPRAVKTPHGTAEVVEGRLDGHTVVALARHGHGHRRLSSQVTHRANLAALQTCGVQAIVATTAVGLLDHGLPIGVPIVFDELFFPSNRLPDGGLVTFFEDPGQPGRGHWIPDPAFSPSLRRLVVTALRHAGIEPIPSGCYVHADGPRFNTPAEHAWMRAAGGLAVSQTCGPEAVLAGELGIPYALVGIGVNAAPLPGIAPPPDEGLDILLGRHHQVAGTLVGALCATIPSAHVFRADTGTVYRFP